VAEQYEFLSPEWLDAAKRVYEEMPKPENPPAHSIRMNQVITEAPFSGGDEIKVHLDTSDGEVKMEQGHLETPDLTVTVDWATAKAIFVEQNPQAGMQAFMAGKIKVQGDMTKMMAMQQSGPPDPNAQAIADKIKEMTL
jgi:putative sterol carrier protein